MVDKSLLPIYIERVPVDAGVLTATVAWSATNV